MLIFGLYLQLNRTNEEIIRTKKPSMWQTFQEIKRNTSKWTRIASHHTKPNETKLQVNFFSVFVVVHQRKLAQSHFCLDGAHTFHPTVRFWPGIIRYFIFFFFWCQINAQCTQFSDYKSLRFTFHFRLPNSIRNFMCKFHHVFTDGITNEENSN